MSCHHTKMLNLVYVDSLSDFDVFGYYFCNSTQLNLLRGLRVIWQSLSRLPPTRSSKSGVMQILFVNVHHVAPLPVVVGEGIMSDASELSIS